MRQGTKLLTQQPVIGRAITGTEVYCRSQDEPLYCLALKFRGFNFSESQKATGYQDSALKGQAQYLIQADTQHRESSLKSARVLHGDLLTNFRACVGKSGICRSLLQPWKY